MSAEIGTAPALNVAHELSVQDGKPPLSPPAPLTLSALLGLPVPQAAVAWQARREGSEVLYVGTASRLNSFRGSAWLRRVIPEDRIWRLPPLANIVRSARRVMPDLLRNPSERSLVLGVMCLPPPVADALVSRKALAQHPVLILDGVREDDPEVAQALAGIRALCDRVNAKVHCFA